MVTLPAIACNVEKKLLYPDPNIALQPAADFIKEKIFLKKSVKDTNAIPL